MLQDSARCALYLIRGIGIKPPRDTCGNLPNCTVTYGNNIYWTFRKYARTTKPPVLIPILSNKTLHIKNDYVINDNKTSKYDQAYDSNEEVTEKVSMVITI